MKTKNYGAFALAAVLLLTAALIIGCPEPLGPGGWSGMNSGTRAGYLTLNIGGIGVSGRTVMPGTPTFDSYKVTIAPDSTNGNAGTTTVTEQPITITTNTGTIAVTEGDYIVTVKAYINDSSSAPILAAQGIDDEVTVTASGGTATIALKEITTSGSGTFKWNLTLPTMLVATDTATMNLTTITGGPVTGVTNINILTTPSNTTGVSVDAGFYYVTVTLGKTGYATFTKGEVVHIYAGQDTNYTNGGVAFAALATNLYDVTYANVIGAGNTNTAAGNIVADKNNDEDPSDPTDLHFVHGSLIRDYFAAGNPGDGDLVNTTNPTYTWGGWFKDMSYTPANQWNFASSRIINNTTLYAKWNAPLVLTVNVDYTTPGDTTLTLDDGGTPVTSKTFSQAALLGTATTLTFELTNAATFFSIEWRNGSTPLTTAANGSLILDLADSANVNFLVVNQPYYITVIVRSTNGGTPYSGTFELTITN